MRLNPITMSVHLDEAIDSVDSALTVWLDQSPTMALVASRGKGPRITLRLRHFRATLHVSGPTSIGGDFFTFDPLTASPVATDILTSLLIEWMQTDAGEGEPHTGSYVHPVTNNNFGVEITVPGTYLVTITPVFATEAGLQAGTLAQRFEDVVIAGAD